MASSVELAAGTQVPTDVPAAEKPFPPFDSANFAPLLIWLAITFGLLYLLMSKLALPRVASILEARAGKINGDLGVAGAKRKEADHAAADYQKTLADARTQAQALAQETYARLADEAEAKRHALEADLASKLSAAEAQIEATKAKAMGNVEQIAKDTASAIVEHLTGKPADPESIAAAIAKSRS